MTPTFRNSLGLPAFLFCRFGNSPVLVARTRNGMFREQFSFRLVLSVLRRAQFAQFVLRVGLLSWWLIYSI